MWQKLLKLSGNQKQPAVSQPYDQSVAIWPQITTPVWPTPENLYDAKSAILTMSKKFVTVNPSGYPSDTLRMPFGRPAD